MIHQSAKISPSFLIVCWLICKTKPKMLEVSSRKVNLLWNLVCTDAQCFLLVFQWAKTHKITVTARGDWRTARQRHTSTHRHSQVGQSVRIKSSSLYLSVCAQRGDGVRDQIEEEDQKRKKVKTNKLWDSTGKVTVPLSLTEVKLACCSFKPYNIRNKQTYTYFHISSWFDDIWKMKTEEDEWLNSNHTYAQTALQP